MEFLVHIELVETIPGGPEAERLLREREKTRAAELAKSGKLIRLWRVPGMRANWGIWRVQNAAELHQALRSLPMFPYMKIRADPLEVHPNDPMNQENAPSPPIEAQALPGLRGTDHLGVTVPDLEEATRFFCDIIGCTAFYDVGPIASETDWMKAHLNVHPQAEITKLRFLRCGNGINLELLEYSSPDQRREMPKNSDYGAHHLALYVDDFDEALSYLRRKSVKILGDPTIRRQGPNAGVTWIYFLTPWGMQMELVSYPGGKGYESTRADRLWHPSSPDK